MARPQTSRGKPKPRRPAPQEQTENFPTNQPQTQSLPQTTSDTTSSPQFLPQTTSADPTDPQPPPHFPATIQEYVRLTFEKIPLGTIPEVSSEPESEMERPEVEICSGKRFGEHVVNVKGLDDPDSLVHNTLPACKFCEAKGLTAYYHCWDCGKKMCYPCWYIWTQKGKKSH